LHPLLTAASELAQRLAAESPRIERERRVPTELVRSLAAAGIFRMCVPEALGGGEVHPETMVSVLETLAHADGSTGWCAMIAATTSVLAGYLPDAAAREIYGDPAVVTGGAFAPSGTAVAGDGSYRVTGHWTFASGCQHCEWLMGGSRVLVDGKPRVLPNGMPDNRLMIFPARAARILDTWYVAGLSGTGSHDIAVDDLEVPAAHSVSLLTDRPRATGRLYAFPVFGLLALGIAAVALGIARRAIDELVGLAPEKVPSLQRRKLAERAATQSEVARAEAALGGARAFLMKTIADVWEVAGQGALTLRHRALLRLAATQAATGAAVAVDLMYNAGGGTAIYASSPLQRCFRDVHVLTQHTLVAPATLELVGRVLLGVEADTAML
jgi:alkylation response protein AidB-like acyl-CoA dehydrogenase